MPLHYGIADCGSTLPNPTGQEGAATSHHAPGHAIEPASGGKEETPNMSITGFRHVGIAVTDLERSAAWYARVLDFEELFREADGPRRAVVMGRRGTPLLFGLVHFANGANDEFSPFRTGLDHLCFAVANREEVEAWARRLDERGVANAGVEEMKTSPVVHFKDPDGIALAIAVLPGAAA
jgi:glyoxylase I family protein